MAVSRGPAEKMIVRRIDSVVLEAKRATDLCGSHGKRTRWFRTSRNHAHPHRHGKGLSKRLRNRSAVFRNKSIREERKGRSPSRLAFPFILIISVATSMPLSSVRIFVLLVAPSLFASSTTGDTVYCGLHFLVDHPLWALVCVFTPLHLLRLTSSSSSLLLLLLFGFRSSQHVPIAIISARTLCSAVTSIAMSKVSMSCTTTIVFRSSRDEEMCPFNSSFTASQVTPFTAPLLLVTVSVFLVVTQNVCDQHQQDPVAIDRNSPLREFCSLNVQSDALLDLMVRFADFEKKTSGTESACLYYGFTSRKLMLLNSDSVALGSFLGVSDFGG